MRSLAFLALLLSSAALAQDGGAAPPHPLAGTWKLDLSKTTDPKEILEHFDANFIVRAFASSVVSFNLIEWKPTGFELEVRAPVYNRKTSIKFDGTTPTADEILGAPYSYTSTLVDGAVVSTGSVKLKDGTVEPLAMRREVAADGTMVLQMTITPKDKKAIEVKRVFRRQAP